MGDLVFNGGGKCRFFSRSISTDILISFKGKYGIWGGNQQYVYPGWRRPGANDIFLGLRSGISPSTMPRLVSSVRGTGVGLIKV